MLSIPEGLSLSLRCFGHADGAFNICDLGARGMLEHRDAGEYREVTQGMCTPRGQLEKAFLSAPCWGLLRPSE